MAHINTDLFPGLDYCSGLTGQLEDEGCILLSELWEEISQTKEPSSSRRSHIMGHDVREFQLGKLTMHLMSHASSENIWSWNQGCWDRVSAVCKLNNFGMCCIYTPVRALATCFLSWRIPKDKDFQKLFHYELSSGESIAIDDESKRHRTDKHHVVYT